jgi:sterol desaturase/sphingolipid hydroxylase (fatty acid hydroxylase superfamily)
VDAGVVGVSMSALDTMIANEGPVRLAIFVAVLSLLAVAERLWPARGDSKPASRQLSNFALVAIDTLLLRVAFPLLAVAFAIRMHEAGTGAFGRLDAPLWMEITLAILLFDVAIYAQHRLLHRVPLLWRMHRVHHTDLAFDVSTGLRFHPGEILLSMGYNLGVIALLGPSAITVACYEMLLVGFALITHANVSLPTGVDRLLRRVFVTPDWHRVHHSVHRDETDSNYGNILSLWDRIFASYRAQPRAGHVAMQIGLPQLRDAEFQSLSALLLQPARRVLPTSGTE